MCMKRDPDDSDKLFYPFPLFDFIDLTMDELTGDIDGVDAGSSIDDDDDDELATPARDTWNYPYNLLPSMQISDDDIPARLNYADLLEDVSYGVSVSNDYIPTNTNHNITLPASINISINIAETNGTGQFNEEREFELNIPQILLSMSTISNNLFGQPTTFRN